MKISSSPIARLIVCLALLAALIAGISSSTLAQGSATPAKHGILERIKVHGKSLEGNLEGDSADRDVSVYLPPSYSAEKRRVYPVIYLLHGFTDKDSNWFGNPQHFAHAGEAIDRAFSSGVPEMIVVMPNAYTLYQGSMYSNSAMVGDWESFVAKDLVAYVDSHYRTIPDRMSRGLAGHSMGGYGTFRIAMKHPEVFSSIYAMSACCLTLSPFFEDRSQLMKIEAAQATVDQWRSQPPTPADFLIRAAFAEAAAWSPNPKNPPLLLDLPSKNGEPQTSVAARWAANAPIAMLDQYLPSLKSLHAIAFDIGTLEQAVPPATVEAMHERMNLYDIPHTYETYEGDHLNRIGERLETKVLPFFAKNLSFGSAKP